MTDKTQSPPTEAELPIAYDPSAVERKWQERWVERGTNQVDLAGADPYYTLMMFPYPSAEGLHVGNLFAFTGNDIHGRFQRMRGHTVFEPFGYDAFGIHSENYALKVGVNPNELIPRNIANFGRQVRRAGLMVDWRYAVSTTDAAYYKWTQWLFLQLFKRGLAYKKKGAVNWCPFDKTVLANEQVINGACERCGTMVEQRFLEQWFFRITDYAGRLLENLETLDWSESTKTAQRNWIGKSEGAELSFRVQDLMEFAGSATVGGGGLSGEVISTPVELRVFTTRADTIFGATFLVVAPEHPLVDRLATEEQRAAVEAYRDAAGKQDIVTRKVNREKTGVFTGSYAINPANGELLPIWVADYVLMEYGTGAIMAVPGHDERDFEFARKFGLSTPRVVGRDAHDTRPPTDAAFTDTTSGVMVNSGKFSGQGVAEAKRNIVDWLARRGAAKPVVQYRLHDWCISRQRYWGPPIPIIYCDACGPVPVPEKDLPVVLPRLENFRPDDSGVSPLARDKSWFRVSCPTCGKPARRETDVSDTFLDSAWYFLRYPSADRTDVAFDAARTRHWLPVNSYIGGNEHAVLHLLYSRFITMVLHDAGMLAFEEPFTRFRAHGTIVRDGAKMSKSRGNVVNPDEYVEKWGADSFRTYLMFLGPYEEGGDFRDQSISGVRRFLDRVWASAHEVSREGEPAAGVMRKLHQVIDKVTNDLPALSYNTAIAAMMEYVNVLRAHERRPHVREVEPLVQLVAPFAPHVAEELWEVLGHHESVFDAGWPVFDAALAVEESVTVAVQVNGRTRGTVQVPKDAGQDAVVEAAMAEPVIAKFVTGAPKKVIYVKNRLLNLVIQGL
ncbi:MAG TPA: leucine--tRNA ligase [Gemmatimonadaceae bacterium]|nr:leucine--tRNA ligase [Gemmatimonadaceae bacterium]